MFDLVVHCGPGRPCEGCHGADRGDDRNHILGELMPESHEVDGPVTQKEDTTPRGVPVRNCSATFRSQLQPRLQKASKGKRRDFFVDAAHSVLGAFLGLVWCFVRPLSKRLPGARVVPPVCLDGVVRAARVAPARFAAVPRRDPCESTSLGLQSQGRTGGPGDGAQQGWHEQQGQCDCG